MKRPLKQNFTATYRTTDVGFVKATVDAPCPTGVGNNNWVDAHGNPFNQPGIIIKPCPENEGILVGVG